MVGIISALGSFLVVFLAPALARWNIYSDSINTIKQIKLFSILGIVSSIVLYFTQTLWMIYFCFMIIIIIFNLFIGLLNTLSGELTNRGFQLNFGVARAANALVFALITPLLGILVNYWNINVIVIFGGVGFLLMFLIANRIPMQTIEKLPAKNHPTQPIENKQRTKFEGLDKNFLLFLISVCFLFISHQYINTYMLQMFQAIGGSTKEMSVALSIGAWAEIPIMVFYEKINRKFPDRSLIIFSAWAFFIKAAATLFAGTVNQMYLANSLQFFAFAIYITGSVYYINKKFPANMVGTGQAAAVSAMTAGMVLGALSGGVIIDVFSVDILQKVSVLSALLGGILMSKALWND